MSTAPRHILLVEDDQRDRELILIALGECRLAGNLVVVSDGAEVLDYLHRRGAYAQRPSGNPAVVLLDLKMPKLGGFEVLREIRATPSLRSLPVVMVTSSREEADIRESYELGANAFIVKPVDFESLADAMKSIGLFWAVLNQPPPETLQS